MALLLVLYLFLWQVVAVIWRDLRRALPEQVKSVPAIGRMIVIHPGGTSYETGHAVAIYGTTTIGRSPDNNLVLSDGFVSSSHAVLDLRDGTWWLTDLDSRNGTWVNGEKISQEVEIRPGDVVAIGQVKLKLAR